MAVVLRVVAAVLHDGAGRVLVNERPPGKAWAGYWEFPGGKLHAGESEPECVARELREELDITVLAQHPLMALTHDYPERTVHLGVHVVDGFAGVPHGAEGQQLRWLQPAGLGELPLLPADAPIITILCRALPLPRTIVAPQGS
jgi:8-oxo-dGTP diphosphatase